MRSNSIDSGAHYSPRYTINHLKFTSIVVEGQSFIDPTSDIAGHFVVRVCSAGPVRPFVSRIHSVSHPIHFRTRGTTCEPSSTFGRAHTQDDRPSNMQVDASSSIGRFERRACISKSMLGGGCATSRRVVDVRGRNRCDQLKPMPFTWNQPRKKVEFKRVQSLAREESLEATKTVKIGFIGGGQMTEAIVRAFVATLCIPPENVWVHDRNENRREIFRNLGVNVPQGGSVEVGETCDAIVLSVKPQKVMVAMKELAGLINETKILYSVVAGLSIEKMQAQFPDARVIRLMPNTPVSVRCGVVGYSVGSSTKEADLLLTDALFSAAGMAVQVQEYQLDALTGVSGSGPAYMFLALEAMADGGVAAGLPRALSLRIAAQTMKGAAEMVLQENGAEPLTHPAILKDKVASPAGTTIEGVTTLEKHGFRSSLIEAVKAAAARSRALGGK